jgi:hypothetical protein
MANVKKVASLGLTRTGTSISDVPDAPTIGSATNVGTSRAFNNGSATVAYTAAATGGPVTTFTATSTPGSFTGTGTSPITVTGLQSATSYTFTVSAANANGTFTSASSSSITATTVPQAPTIGTASSPTSTTASVPFTANATGGSAITGFTATSSPGGLTGTGSSSPITVSGLTAGTAYTFTVTATNANGTSAASSASNSVTPNIPYFLATLDQGGVNDIGKNIKVDSSGNTYIAGYIGGSGTDAFVAKYNSSGAVQWQRRLTSAAYEAAFSLVLDSSSNVYITGYATNDFLIAKYNSSGTLQWQRKLGNATGGANGIGVDSSGNVYVAGVTVISSVTQLTTAKYSSSGTLQWQRKLGTSGNSPEVTGLAVDSSANVYIVGSNQSKLILVKYNTSGTIQWQNTVNGSSEGRCIALDSAGNLYVGAKIGSPSKLSVLKYNSSGAIQWQRTLTPENNSAVPNSIAVDSSGNIYVGGETNTGGSGPRDMYFAKYNNSGTIQWQRRIAGYDSDWSEGIDVDSSGNLFFTGATWLGSYGILSGVIPTDGSKTGTYTVGSQSFLYTTASNTDEAGSLSVATLSLNESASTVTDAALSLTDSATTLTANVTSI